MRRVLLVDDDKENIELLTSLLSGEGYNIQTANEGETAMHRLKAWKPHLVLLDVNMPGTSGLELISRIRSASPDDYVSIVLVSGNTTDEDVKKGFDAGCDDYVTKPFRAQELLSRLRIMLRIKELQDSLRRATHRIEELSMTDDLTGLFNIRALYRRGEEEIMRSSRFKKPISGLLINIDHFTDVNQQFGFLFGSQVLQEIGHKIKQCLRSIDLAARIGSDEFFCLLVETDLAGAEFVAERIRDAIQSTTFKTDKQTAKITASIGVAGFASDHADHKMGDLLHITSEALRSAKATSPNSIEVYSFA